VGNSNGRMTKKLEEDPISRETGGYVTECEEGRESKGDSAEGSRKKLDNKRS